MTQPQTPKRVTVVIEMDDYRVTVTAREPLVKWNLRTPTVAIQMGGYAFGMLPLEGSAELSMELHPQAEPLDVSYESLGSPGLAAAAQPSPGEVSGPRAGEGRGAPYWCDACSHRSNDYGACGCSCHRPPPEGLSPWRYDPLS